MPSEQNDIPELSISADKACFIVAKARQFAVKDVLTDPGDSSNPADDEMVQVLEDHRADPVVKELVSAIYAMNDEERVDLIVLTWLGRGDGTLADWSTLREEARREHGQRTARYLLGMPLLADYLAEGLSLFDVSCRE